MEMANCAQAVPFAKVKGLIEDIVAKLMEQAKLEADHKSFCGEEIGKSRKKREKSMMDMDEFQARMDKASSAMQGLTEQIKVLQSEIAAIDAAQRKAVMVRKEEKENDLAASSEFNQSAEAVVQAIQVLKKLLRRRVLAGPGAQEGDGPAAEPRRGQGGRRGLDHLHPGDGRGGLHADARRGRDA